jgi:SNF2 family DNA or RNA helicase
MKSMALAMLEDGSMATTTNVLTQIMRLQQICCGHFKNDEGHVIDLDNNRIDELLNICEETDGKVIIWANWVHDIVKIGEALAIKYGQKAVQSYYGSTEQSTRQNVVEEFQKPDSPLRFFIGNTQTGGFGLTLTEAKTVIYYSNSRTALTVLVSSHQSLMLIWWCQRASMKRSLSP